MFKPWLISLALSINLFFLFLKIKKMINKLLIFTTKKCLIFVLKNNILVYWNYDYFKKMKKKSK